MSTKKENLLTKILKISLIFAIIIIQNKVLKEIFYDKHTAIRKNNQAKNAKS